MGKKDKNNTMKKTTVVKEQDVIKESDFEGATNNKMIIVVSLILALLIGGFAYIRTLDKKEETPNVEEPNNDIEEEVQPPVVEEKPNINVEYEYDYGYIYQPVKPVEKPKEEVIDIWKDLNTVPSSIEAGSDYTLPEIKVKDNNEDLSAVITYMFKTNEENSEYTAVTLLDLTKIGKYLVTYTMNYGDGTVDTKELELDVIDTVEPIINDIEDGKFYNSDITLNITEYSPYIVELNGAVYDETLPITTDGEYTLTVTEDTVEGRSITVTFTIDKTLPVIEGAENNKYYANNVIINVIEENIETITLTKDGEEITFTNGVTSFDEEGIYVITATDLASNNVSYTFTIDKTLPIVNMEYTPDNSTLTNSDVTVVITGNEMLQEISGWTISEDKLTLTKEFTENGVENLEVKDLAGNIVNVDVVVDYIDYTITYSPKLTLENLVTNKVKATITSLKQLTINEQWKEILLEDGTYSYEKIYDAKGIEVVNYTDSDGINGTIEVNIEIELTAFVTYKEDTTTQNVTAIVLTEEEVLELPEGWEQDATYTGAAYKYYKVYTENIEYEIVEFITLTKHYVATIVIDSIDREAPEAEVDIMYIKENDEKKSVVITVSASEEIEEVEGWSMSEDNGSILQIIEKPVEVPTEEVNGTVTITDLTGNETIVEYTYNWN